MRHLLLLFLFLYHLCAFSTPPTLAPLPNDLQEYLAQPQNKREGIPPLPIQSDFRTLKNLHKTGFKTTPFPLVYDLRELGLVTRVKSQGSELGAGGNCWAFTALGAIESQWLTLGYDTFSLSEHSMSSCHGFEWPYGDGGNDWLAMAYLTRLQGPILEQERPYTPDDYSSHACIQGFTPTAYVPEVRWVPGNNEQVLKYSLIHYGAISVSMRWQNASYNPHNHTYLYSGSGAVNHAVLLCGWNDTLQTDVGRGAWIMKNQWGEAWADSGYFYIAYEDSKTNYTASFYPEKVPVNRMHKIHYYDTLSALRITGYMNPTGHALTRFTTDGQEFIHRLGTFIPEAGMVINIAVFSSFSDDSLSGLLFEKKSIHHELPGFYTYPAGFSADGEFFVRITYTHPGGLTPIPIEIPIPGYAEPNLQGADGMLNPAYHLALQTAHEKPTVTRSIPANYARGVPGHSPIRLFLDQHISSIDSNGIQLKTPDASLLSPSQLLYDSLSHSLTLHFDTLAFYGALHHLCISENAFFNEAGAGNRADTLSFTLIDSARFHPLHYMQYEQGISTSDATLLVCMSDTLLHLYDSLINISRTFTVKDQYFDLAHNLALSIDPENPSCITVEVPVSQYGEAVHVHFGDSSIQGQDSLYNTSFVFSLTPSCNRVIINRSLPIENEPYFHPDSTISIRFAGQFDSINKNAIDLIRSSAQQWETAPFQYSIDTLNQTLTITSSALKNGSDYNLSFRQNALFFNKQALAGTTSLRFRTAGKYVWAPSNIELYKIHPITQGDSLIRFRFIPAMEANNTDSVLLIHREKGDTLLLPAWVENEHWLNISLPVLEEAVLYDLHVPEGKLKARGNTWISADGFSWSSSGIGRPGHEFHTCIRAYADTIDPAKPFALFDANRRTVCIETPLTFFDHSKGDVDTYHWHFGEDATPPTATGKGPHEVSYTSEGVKSVRLITSGNLGSDTAIAHNFIQVKSSITLQPTSLQVEVGIQEAYPINLDGADEYEWIPTYWLDTTRGASVVFQSPFEGTYTYYIKGTQGSCVSYDSVQISVINRPPNDNVCHAMEVSMGINGMLDDETGALLPFTNRKATVEDGEPHPPGTHCNTQSTWCPNTPMLAYTVWFTFVAPASGSIAINTIDEYSGQQRYEFDNKIALYTADTCTDILNGNYTLVAANDDYYDIIRSYSAKITKRHDLTPGKRYWIQVDGSFGGIEGDFYLTLTNGTVGLDNTTLAEHINVYPNPFSQSISIVFNEGMNDEIDETSIAVYAINGLKMPVQKQQIGNVIWLPTETWTPGIYLLNITNHKGTYQQIIVKE